jgi:uncharacterized protein YbaP (TraB family)
MFASGRWLAGTAIAVLACMTALGAENPQGETDTELDEVQVTGERPGPAMWKVRKGEHTLWIMGTLSPLPAKMTWKSKEAEQVIRDSGEILADSVNSLALGDDVGMIESIRLLRAVMRLRHNADGSTTREALPDDVYQRWHEAHRRWFGHAPDKKEKARPIYAAELLYTQALEKSGLTTRPLVWSTAEKLAKQHKVKIRRREFPIELEDPRGFIAELAELPRDKEVACLVATMDYIEREVPDMKRRAQAWAVGDLETLRALPRGQARQSCFEAALEKPRIREMATDTLSKFASDWSGIVDWLLLTHQTSFTTLPIARLLDPDGVLAQLRARGYEVVEPM